MDNSDVISLVPPAEKRQHASPVPWIVATIVLAIMAALAIWDYESGPNYNPAIAFPTLLLSCWWVRSRRFLWGLTLLAIVVSLTAGLGGGDDLRAIFHRVLSLLALLATAGICHYLIDSWQAIRTKTEQLENSRQELLRFNTDMAAREQDIATQNEELRSQTEELERQSEELRCANDELARRERALESLLRLSRSLTAEMSRVETLDRICLALGDILPGPDIGVGVKMREGESMRLVCHHGFGDAGAVSDAVPFQSSFARLVLEKNQLGFIEDITVRPDLVIPVPKEGPPFRSILAAPLRVNGHSVGTLEVYSRERRTWSEEQIAIIQSLASQTSISLQAAELFERIDQERERLRTVLNTIPIGIAIATDETCENVRTNPAGAALTGVPADSNLMSQANRRRFRVLRHGQELVGDERPILRACRGEVIDAEELDLLRNDGRRIPIMINAAPIHGPDGKIAGAVAAFIDVSQQKHLQQELDSRRRIAEEASVRKSRFLAQVSHDIRNPVNAISLLAELLYRAASEPAMAGEVSSIAGDLRKNAVSLVNLIGDVLDLTRFEAGRVELEETEFSLNDLVVDECRTYQSMAAEKGLEFAFDLPQRAIIVRTDRVKLSRVLGNLVSNAMKFTESGRVQVQAGYEPDGVRNADAAGHSEGGANGNAEGPRSVWIRVSDTGPGIAPEFHTKIFDEFFQLRNTNGQRGTGLGLAICKRLIDAMGGRIELRSEPGKGSDFVVKLPPAALVRP